MMYARALGSYFEVIHRSIRKNIIDKGQTGTNKDTLSQHCVAWTVSKRQEGMENLENLTPEQKHCYP